MLKLYVWENVLCNYSSGIAFALADTVESAREIILKKFENRFEDTFSYRYNIFKKELEENEPKIHETSIGYFLWGSE